MVRGRRRLLQIASSCPLQKQETRSSRQMGEQGNTRRLVACCGRSHQNQTTKPLSPHFLLFLPPARSTGLRPEGLETICVSRYVAYRLSFVFCSRFFFGCSCFLSYHMERLKRKLISNCLLARQNGIEHGARGIFQKRKRAGEVCRFSQMLFVILSEGPNRWPFKPVHRRKRKSMANFVLLYIGGGMAE